MAAAVAGRVPREAFEIQESVAAAPATITLEEALASAPSSVRERVERLLEANPNVPDAGLVPIYIIRPGIGRGKGKHLYEADMLARNAGVFKGWRQYTNHLSESARKALGGLPRPVQDLGGRLVESWWDPAVPADQARGHGQGAVVGLSRPVPYIRELIDSDPGLIEASIAARAGAVHPRQVGGERVWVVESIENKGSVDWVTEAGAGGRVASLIEAHYDDEVEDMSLLESLSDDDVLDHIKAERPELAALLNIEEAGDGEDSSEEEDDDGFEGRVKALMKKGLNRKMAERAARRAMEAEEGRSSEESADTEEDDVPLTAETLREALSTDEGQELLEELLGPMIEVRAGQLLNETLPDKIEEALAEERELLMIEARADAERQIQLRDLRDEAHRMVAESKLPLEFQAEVKAKFDITENGPTQGLDVLDEMDGEGNVTKTAQAVLTEAVEAEIARQRTLLAAARPTRVHAAPPARKKEDGEEDDGGDAPKSTGSPKTDALLAEAGFSPDELGTVYVHG